ncbi:hypothetical protein [Leuconostoc pseudomesenteroides]|uniref:hypothetical protein n=1 Tax=Leuconostoc pseudomesenteroides TaxID=33968 RepID=UPI00403741EE
MNDEVFSKMINNYFDNDYRERGKVKWNGYFLSDHTSALKREAQAQNNVPVKLPSMSLTACQAILRHASANYEFATVQQNISDADGNLVPNLTGLVDGFSDLGVYVQDTYIAFENIRAVERVC